jgi:peptidoglycan hydrolase CwlO-like protein
MEDIFPGYSRKTENQIKKIWEKGILIFDANVLLNLYRYSDSTRNTILNLIERFKDRIWLPHQSALEYNKNRYEVIADQEKAYKEFTEKITQIQTDLQSTSKPPFLSDSVHKDLNKVFEKVTSEVEESIKKYCDYLKADPIYEKLSNLFKDRITEPFNEKTLNEIYKEGEERYKLKIPPGYEDEKNKEGNRKFGDLVLWKQIIYKTKKEKSPVIFITDERKMDWWWKIRDGRNMGPRQELVEEIKREASVDFHMYSSERFLSYGQNFLEESVNQKAFEEIQAMKRAEIEHFRRLRRERERERENRYKYNLKPKEELNFLQRRYRDLMEQIKDISRQQEMLTPNALENVEIQEYINNLNIQISELEEERQELKKRIQSYDMHELDDKERELDFKKEMMYKLFLRDRNLRDKK